MFPYNPTVPYQDLRGFITALEKAGELRRVTAEVDPHLEMTAVADRVVKQGGPALLFEHPRGFDIPVLINAFGSIRRIALALEVENISQVAERIAALLEFEPPRSLREKMAALPKLAELASYSPKPVRTGPAKQVAEQASPSLDRLPILKCWPGDGGRFITLPLVITCDADSGRPNLGMYRMHVYDERTTGLHWHPHKDAAVHYQAYVRRGERMPVAVALGADPATIYAATAPLPYGMDELVFAGFLRRAPVEVVRCETCDLYVPAHAEIVLEGYVEPGELRLEGPFGDHTGYYSPADHYPVFHLTCITRRRQPIYPATMVGRPPMEDCFLGKATERIFLPLLKLVLPELVDLNLPLAGVFHNLAIVSIRKQYPGHARKVAHALWGLGQMMFTKVIVVVDEEVNVQDLSEVRWKVLNNIDPERDVFFVRGPVDVLNHAAPVPNFGSKMGIDATRKLPQEGHPREWPEEIRPDREVAAQIERRWKEFGLD